MEAMMEQKQKQKQQEEERRMSPMGRSDRIEEVEVETAEVKSLNLDKRA